MRITNSMLSKSFLYDVNKNLQKLEKSQSQITSGAQIEVASDDPVKAARILKMRSYVSEAEQLQKNADDADSWLEFCDSVLENVGDTIADIKELVTQASNETYSDADLESIKSEMAELSNGLMELGNSSYNGRYVFAGFNTDEAPLAKSTTPMGEMVTYRGSYLSLGAVISSSVSETDIETYMKSYYSNSITDDTRKQEILYKVGEANKVCINAEGNEVFGQEDSCLFNTMQKLDMALSGETSYKTATYDKASDTVTIETHELDISSLLGELSEDASRALNVRAELGAKSSYMELVQNRLSSNLVTFTKLLSKNEDTDYSEAAINLTTANTIYSASLSAGSKVIVNSLLDFLS